MPLNYENSIFDRIEVKHPTELSDKDRADIESLSASIPSLWNVATTACEQRKAIVRCLIDSVSIQVQGRSEVVDVSVGWAGGYESQHQISRAVHRYELLQDYDRLRRRLLELRQSGKTAGEIANTLNDEGFQTARGKEFKSITVQTLLFRSDMTGENEPLSGEQDLPADDRWSIPQLVEKLDVPTTTICHWCRRGWIHAVKTCSNRWVVWADNEEVDRLRKLSAHQRPNPSDEYLPELTAPKPFSETD